MARIRTIKPSFWSSEKIGKLSVVARLTLVGLISQADDEGRGRGATRFLMGTLHPYAPDVEEAVLAGAIVDLHAAKVVVFYEVDGCRYYSLPGWAEHQRIDKPTKSPLPPPPDEEPSLFSDDSKNTPRTLVEDSRQEGKGREEDGNGLNNRPERRGPDDLEQEIGKAAKARDVKQMAGDFGDYRLPKNFGKYAGAYVVNVPPDECAFLLEKMRPGTQVAAALRWRINIKASEGFGKRVTK